MFGNNGSRLASWMIGFLPRSRCFGLKRWLLRAVGGIKVGDGTEIWSGVRFAGKYIEIGKNCHLGEECYISGLAPKAYVKIGDEVSFGPYVFATCGTHDIGDCRRRSGRGRLYPIEIGDGAAVSVRAIIMPNVKIGAGAFIGPGVVVSSDIKPNTMVSQGKLRSIPLPEEGISWE